MSQESQPNDDSIKHLCSLNFSVFTEKLDELRGENRPKDKHGIIRKKWLRLIRNQMKANGVQTLISYLYATKSQIHRNQALTKTFFYRWKSHTSEEVKRSAWKQLLYKLKINEYRKRELKLIECRADLTAQFILSQPKFRKPNFELFVKQLAPIEIDEQEIPKEEEETKNEEQEIKDEPEIQEPVETPEDSVKEREVPIQSPSPRSKRYVYTTEMATETVDPEESEFKKFVKSIDYKNLSLSIFIFFGLLLITFFASRFMYHKLGYYDRYQQYLLNETLPPYIQSYDIDYVVDYTELVDKDQSIERLLLKMAKEIKHVERKQTELFEQIEQLHEHIKQEAL